jgi:muramoyltetrapeptide carboxypeptidase
MTLTSAAPLRVRQGATVAIVSPSFGAVGAWPHRAERGSSYLESLGLSTKLMPNAARNDSWVSASAEERASDIHAAFADPEVDVVLASIGGNHSNQLLPHLDFDLIAAHPKIFQGFSDITVLCWALLVEAGLRTFYGPALTANLGEYPEVFDLTHRSMTAAWFGEEPMRYEPAGEWTEEFLDWENQIDLTRPRAMRPGAGWVTIREGAAEGPLIGGCLESICWHLKGDPFWPDLEGAILFLETSEEAPSPAHVDAYLTDLEQIGTFEQADAVVIGRPRDYSEEDSETLWRVAADRTEPYGLPVLGNVDCGHTDPMLTLPLGCPARVDAGAKTFETLEPATAPRPAGG